jgi:hypothetical protein
MSAFLSGPSSVLKACDSAASWLRSVLSSRSRAAEAPRLRLRHGLLVVGVLAGAWALPHPLRRGSGAWCGSGIAPPTPCIPSVQAALPAINVGRPFSWSIGSMIQP